MPTQKPEPEPAREKNSRSRSRLKTGFISRCYLIESVLLGPNNSIENVLKIDLFSSHLAFLVNLIRQIHQSFTLITKFI